MIVCQDQNSLIAKGIEEFNLKAQSRGMYQNRLWMKVHKKQWCTHKLNLGASSRSVSHALQMYHQKEFVMLVHNNSSHSYVFAKNNKHIILRISLEIKRPVN